MTMLLRTALVLCALTCGAVDAEVEGSVRLRGGRVPLGGRVEVLYGGEWGTVRDGRWGVEDASVVCRQLGFTHAQVAPRGMYFDPAPLSTPVHFNRVSCQGNESSLLECEANIVRERNGSYHAADAGVICATDYSLRLVPLNASSGAGVGRLDLWFGGEWRGVCAGGWEREEAVVACRQLGYEQLVQFSSEPHPSSASPLVTMETNCSGNEFHLLSCHPTTPLNLCTAGTVVRLECKGSPVPPDRPRLEQATCSSLQFTWNEPHNRGSNITSYTLRYKTHAGSPLVWKHVRISRLHPTGEPIGTVLAGLAPTTQYEVQVRAENGVGNSSYSGSLVVATQPADVLPPENLRRDSVGSDSATLSWTAVPPCGTSIARYELLYSKLGSSNTSELYRQILPLDSPTNMTFVFLDSPTNMTFVLNNLRPFSRYEVRMRTVGFSGRGDNATLLVSNFTEPVNIRTLEAAPTGAPQTLSVFLSHLHSSAVFQWDSIPQEEQNGHITGYSFTCQYTVIGHLQTIRRNFNSSVFHYELHSLEPGTGYECHVSAGTAVGQGPESASVEFTTPIDLNIRPSPPANVAFEVRGQPDSGSPVISAQWDVTHCGNNFNCTEALGYVATCQEELTQYELRKTVWQSEVEDVAVAMTTMIAAPYKRYSCTVAALNSYGIGFAGSIITVETPESAPSQAPTLLYASDPQPTSVGLHWSYSELPRTGRLLGFKIKLYYQHPRYPERNTDLVLEEMYDLPPSSTSITNFSYMLMYLSPGVEYNVYLSAHTIAGEGPQARVAVSTLRTAPAYTPTNLQVEIISYQEPYRYSFTWQLPASATPNFIHTGFMLHCYPNTTTIGAQTQNTSHAVFAASLQPEYSATVSPPGSCEFEIDTFLCSVAVFNERGEGPQSGEVKIQLPCIIDSSAGNVFAGTFLSQPYYSLAFLSALVLLIILVLIAIVILCICNRCIGDVRQRRNSRKAHLNPYSSGDTYDESYISMAPSCATRAKSYWTDRSMSCTTGTTVLATSNIGDSCEPYNPYDEIPGDRPENLYDEIPPTTRVISTITHDNLQDSADCRQPTASDEGSMVSSINPGVMNPSVDESGIEVLQQPIINDPNGPTPFTSPRTSSYVPDSEYNTTPVDGIQIPTTLSQISLQADYVEILSSSMSRAVVQNGREDQSIPGTSVADHSQELGSQILPCCNSQETDIANQTKSIVGNAGNIPDGTPISKSAVEVANPNPSHTNYDHLAAREDSGQFSNVTSVVELSVNAGSSSSE